MSLLIRMTIVLALLFPTFPMMVHGAQGEEFFKDIDLDRFIEQEKASVEQLKKKKIARAEPVRFKAKMKRPPEEKNMTYVYTAMEVAGVNPLPDVGHRMFIETAGKRIIPVYVEKATALWLKSGMKAEARAQFLGYHIYSYDKGPAILIVGFNTVK